MNKKIIVPKEGKQIAKRTKASLKNLKAFTEYVKSFTGRLPQNYRFDREEANKR